jgi:mono/diheme cytochrome c family protein
MFPEKFPADREPGYTAFGFIQEPGMDLPVGFSKRRVIIDRVWLNCGACHTGTVRDTPDSPPRVLTGMGANTMDLQTLIRFLVDSASDPRFSPQFMIPEIERLGDLGFIERLLYKYVAIPATRDALLESRDLISFFGRQPSDWGPGRVDTFNPYKVVQFGFPPEQLSDDEIIGTSDLPSIWRQRDRQGMDLHWDGNNDSVEERNKSAALGAGVTPTTIDLAGIGRIEDWLLDLDPPAYPYPIDAALAARGEPIYRTHCADCHGAGGRDFTGESVGRVVPIDLIATDRHRLDSYTRELSANQNTLFSGYPWRFSRFRKTNGYASMPLDGLWLRGPYLHNGSVPTVRDLLEPPERRPEVFYRGYDVIDRQRLGFVSDVAVEGSRGFFEFDTTAGGNGNLGHTYGVDLSPEEKDALVEYLKGF